MKIRIYDVGRQKKETTIEVDDSSDADDIALAIYRTVFKLKALKSREVEATWDDEAKKGQVFAGGRPVGLSEVVS